MSQTDKKMLNVSKKETKIMHLGRQKGRKQTKMTVQHKQGENVERKRQTQTCIQKRQSNRQIKE